MPCACKSKKKGRAIKNPRQPPKFSSTKPLFGKPKAKQNYG